MGRGCYELVAAVLLVLSVERVRSGQGSCRDCPAGEDQLPHALVGLKRGAVGARSGPRSCAGMTFYPFTHKYCWDAP